LSNDDLRKCPFCGDILTTYIGYYYHNARSHSYSCYVNYKKNPISFGEECYTDIVNMYIISYIPHENLFIFSLLGRPLNKYQFNFNIINEIKMKLSTTNIVEANEKIRKLYVFS